MLRTGNPSTLAIVACLLFGVLVILALPNFELPDTAFHRGTTPVVMPAHATPGLATLTIATTVRLAQKMGSSRVISGPKVLADASSPNFLHILLQTLRC